MGRKTCKTCFFHSICKQVKDDKGMQDNQEACSHYSDMKPKKECRTCKWWSDYYQSVCCNDRSDHLADYVDSTGRCPEWEGKNDGQGESDQGD